MENKPMKWNEQSLQNGMELSVHHSSSEARAIPPAMFLMASFSIWINAMGYLHNKRRKSRPRVVRTLSTFPDARPDLHGV